MRSLYLALPGGPKLYVEHAGWTRARGNAFEVRRENGELLVWLGRLHVIYTPGRWRPARDRSRGGPLDGGKRPYRL